MSKINQIQSALQAIDPGSFQKLCDAYLHKLGYDNINPIGSVIGADKTKTGTPDTFVPLSNGKFVFAEYTTESKGVAQKFRKDLKKCFSVEKTGVPNGEIEKIILCYNSQMDVSEVRELRKFCAENGSELDIYSIGKISYDLAQKYPGIAKEYLNIDADTGQIVDRDRFVSTYQASAYATKIDTAFIGRKDDIESALNAIRTGSILLVTGRPGVGKTRFTIEICQRFVEEYPEYKVRYIRGLGADLFNDLRLHFTEPGRYVIVIDDANRLTGLDYVFNLLQETDAEHQFKIVCTVRDYATNKVRQTAATYANPSEITIAPFTEDEIKQLVSVEYTIGSGEYLDRIARLADGNPRIAMMAASVADENQSLDSINDVSALYDRYFESIMREVENLDHPEIWRAAGIITFFRTIDRTNTKQMELINSVFGVDEGDFWSQARRLHELEIVDVYEDDSIVRIADQVLATYLFYRAVFVDRVLDLAPVLTELFPDFRHRLMDAINPVYSAFDERRVGSVLKPSVLTAWEEFEKNENWDALWELMEAFWWLAETRVLKTIRNIVKVMEVEERSFQDVEWKPNTGVPRKSPLSVLKQFRWSNNPANAVKLMLGYCAKIPDSYKYLVHIITEDYGFRHDSYRYGYQYERVVIDKVWEEWEGTRDLKVGRLFVAIAADFIKTHYMSTSSYKRNALTIAKFNLVPTDDLRDLRQTMLRRAADLYKQAELKGAIRDLLYSYPRMGYENEGVEIGIWDMEVLAPFVRESLDPKDFRECSIVQALLAHWRKREVSYDPALDSLFANATYELATLLRRDDEVWLALGYEEYQKKKREVIRERFGSYSADQYQSLLEEFSNILSGLPLQDRDYPYREGMWDVMFDLLERDSSLFVTVMNGYLDSGDTLEFGRYGIARRMVEILGAKRSFEIVEHVPLPQRHIWLGNYYESLPIDAITEDIAKELAEFYHVSDAWSLPYQFNYLKPYLNIDPNIGTDIVKTLLERGAEDGQFIQRLSGLFNIFNWSEADMEVIQSLDSTVLQEAYLLAASANSHIDLHGVIFNFILDQSPDFLQTYIRHRYQEDWSHRWNEDREYSFIWRRPDHRRLLESAIDLNVKLDEQSEIGFKGIGLRLLQLSSEAIKAEPGLVDRRVTALEEIIASRNREQRFMQFLFKAASEFGEDVRRRLIAQFLKHNHRIDDFRSLPLEPNHWSSNGTWVPVWAKRKEFYQSILPLVSSIELLDHREIIESQIAILEKQIEHEKRKDFLGD